MPCKKKKYIPLYFQIYTHLFTDLFRFSFCASVKMFEEVCVIFSNSTEKNKKNMHIQTSADDWW